jgi:hypothetical protein
MTAVSSSATEKTTRPHADLSLNEMLRVMDVAREMRKDREVAEQALARDEVRAALRTKLMRTAELSGDRVTEAEIDAAIDTYFSNRHQYRDPEFSLPVLLAHLWIRRGPLLWIAGVGLLLLGMLWSLFFAPFAPLSSQVQQRRAAVAAVDESSNLTEQIAAVAIDPETVREAQRLAAQIDAAGSDDPAAALAAADQLRELHRAIVSSYEIQMTQDAQGTNLFEVRQQDGRLSGYYVVVRAVDEQGNAVPQPIRNAETSQITTVTQWAERIPAAVFERLAADKQSDGVLDETLFAVKPRGTRELEVQLTDPSGDPIERSVQITTW